MIVAGGENIASSEVERVLYEQDAMLEAAVSADLTIGGARSRSRSFLPERHSIAMTVARHLRQSPDA